MAKTNGTNGNDYLLVTSTNDIIQSDNGNHILIGSDGSDRYYVNNTGNVVIE
jgi:Ca2+-binding RTX toxin-like protein